MRILRESEISCRRALGLNESCSESRLESTGLIPLELMKTAPISGRIHTPLAMVLALAAADIRGLSAIIFGLASSEAYSISSFRGLLCAE